MRILWFTLTIGLWGTSILFQAQTSPNGWGSQAGFHGPDDTAPGAAWIIGTVVAADGRPVDGAAIEMHGGPGAPAMVYSSRDGSFRIDKVPIGVRELTAKQNLTESREYVSISPGANWVTLILPNDNSSKSKDAVVSATQLAVPSKARRELEKAADALHKNKLVDAARFIERALVAWPKFSEALVLRAAMEREQKSPQLAAADAEKAIEFDPSYPNAYFVLGSAYNDLNRWDDAIRTLDHGIVIGPNYWQGYYEMSRALLLKGDFIAALRQADKSSSMAPPGFASLHLVKGYAYLGLRDSTAARTELEAYMKLRPNSEGADRVRQLLERLPDPSAAKSRRDGHTVSDQAPIHSASDTAK